MDESELLKAVAEGDVAAVEALLAAGAQINGASPVGETALMRASSRGHLDVVRLLLDAGADVNGRRGDGMTPLIYAAFFGHADVVRLLMDNGADLDARDRLGMRALDWAKSKGATAAAAALSGAAVRDAASSGERPAASRHGVQREIETEEILDLPGAGAVLASVESAEGLLDLSGLHETREHTSEAHTLLPDVTPSVAEPPVERSRTEPRPTSISESKTKESAAKESAAQVAFEEPSLQGQPLSWLPLLGLSLAVMFGSAALTWMILRRDESQTVRARPATVSPTVPGATPQAPKSDDDAALTAALNDWLEATRARDVEKMVSFYAPSLRAYYRKRFVPSSVVRADKAELFERAHGVDIKTDAPEIRYGKKSSTASMRFRKVFSIESDAGSRSGEVVQELVWRKTKDGWKIISERDVQIVR